MLNDDIWKRLAQSLQQAADVGRVIQSAFEKQAEQMQHIAKVTEGFSRSLQGLPDKLLKAPDWLSKLDRAGLTPNLGKDRSIYKLKQYKRLLGMGYAIFWVPRAEIVEALLGAKNEQDRKKIVLKYSQEILEDCQNALDDIGSPSLKNPKLHLVAAIETMRTSNPRAAQSTASVCFDALLDQIIDSSSLRTYREVYPKVSGDGNKLKSVDNIPVQYLYAALQAQLVVFSMRKFERLQPQTVQTKYGRHSSIHSVSPRQYNDFNALQAITVTTSLLATTDKLGKGWLTGLSDLV